MTSSLESLWCDEALDLGSVEGKRSKCQYTEFLGKRMIIMFVKNYARLGVWLGLGVLL